MPSQNGILRGLGKGGLGSPGAVCNTGREILEKHLFRCRELAECAGGVQKCFPDNFEFVLKFFIIFLVSWSQLGEIG